MYRLYVMQHQWALLGLFTGLVFICATALTYMMMWTERDESDEKETQPEPEQRSFVQWYFSFMPWILQITFLFSILFAILFVGFLLANPPNW